MALANNGWRLHELCKKMLCLSSLWKLYSLTTRILTSYHCFIAFQCMRTWCSRSNHTKVLRRLYIYIDSYDHYSKWVEVVPLKEVNEETAINFIQINIIDWYGVPQYIITYNGKFSTIIWLINYVKILGSTNITLPWVTHN